MFAPKGTSKEIIDTLEDVWPTIFVAEFARESGEFPPFLHILTDTSYATSFSNEGERATGLLASVRDPDALASRLAKIWPTLPRRPIPAEEEAVAIEHQKRVLEAGRQFVVAASEALDLFGRRDRE